MGGHIGGNQEEMLTIEKFAGYKTEVEEKIQIRERLALRNKVKEEHSKEIYQGVKRRHRNENVFEPPNGLHENAVTAISCREPGPAKKKKEVYQ